MSLSEVTVTTKVIVILGGDYVECEVFPLEKSISSFYFSQNYHQRK